MTYQHTKEGRSPGNQPRSPIEGTGKALSRQPDRILAHASKNRKSLHPLQEHIESFQQSNETADLSPHTIEKYRSHLTAFCSWLNTQHIHSLDQITPKVLRQFMLHRKEKGDRPATRRSFTQVLKTFFTFLVDEEIIKENHNPARRLKNPKVPTSPPKWLSDQEVADLLDSFDKDKPHEYRDYVVCLLMLDTGLRAGEVSQIKVSDLDLANSKISVIGNGDRFRFAYFGADMGRVLQDYLDAWHRHLPLRYKAQGSAPLFPVTSNNSRGQAVKRRHITAVVRKKMDQVGIPRCYSSSHRLRHTFGRNLARNGANAFQLKGLLGHATLSMTMRYVRLSEDDLAEAHRKASPVDRLSL